VRATVALFDPQRLEIARKCNGLRRSELAAQVDVSPSAITQLESGHTKPSAATLSRLSLALGFPPDFFLNDGRRPAAKDHGRAFFRSLRATRQIDRDRAAARAFLVSELVQVMERYVRLPRVNLPGDLHLDPERSSREGIEERALALRRFWNVPDGPIANVVRLLELNGVVVTHCIVDCPEVSSFSRVFGDRPVVVLKEERDDVARLRSDAAHELGHLVLHEEPEAGNQIVENQAQAFAGSFLMPRDQIAASLPRSFDIERYHALKKTWGVSMQFLLYRAKELGRMSESTYRRAMMAFSKHRWRINEPFPLTVREETRLIARAFEVISESGIQENEILVQARLPTTFLTQVTHAAVMPAVTL
jgi:Zn-dependent peptidase ImmA (M78 family)/transcriptional regulator with XRE-family HTH domain